MVTGKGALAAHVEETKGRDAQQDRRRAREATKRARIIKWGSDEHRHLLGIDDPSTTPERKADLEKALHANPEAQVQPEEVEKVPVQPGNYEARTRHYEGDEIFDGWVRRGGGR